MRNGDPFLHCSTSTAFQLSNWCSQAVNKMSFTITMIIMTKHGVKSFIISHTDDDEII
jgi:negative regulator of sigma E activity